MTQKPELLKIRIWKMVVNRDERPSINNFKMLSIICKPQPQQATSLIQVDWFQSDLNVLLKPQKWEMNISLLSCCIHAELKTAIHLYTIQYTT